MLLYFVFMRIGAVPSRIPMPPPVVIDDDLREVHMTLSNIASALAAASANAWAVMTTLLRLLISGQADTYRPEAYYMRGPGPKWYAKHAGLTRQTGYDRTCASNTESWRSMA